MSWIHADVDKVYNLDDIYRIWDDTEDNIPQGIVCNSLRSIGTFKTETEAYNALNKSDIVGMNYAIVQPNKISSKLKKAKDQLEKAMNNYKELTIKTSVYNTHNGKTIGCPDCGASYPRIYFKKNSSFHYDSLVTDFEAGKYINSCPICFANLRSKTNTTRLDNCLKTVEKYKTQVKEIETQEKSKPVYLFKINAYVG